MTNIMKPVKNSSDCILKPLGSQKLFSAAPSSSLLVLLPFKNRVQFQESEKKEKKERESLLSRSINSWGKTNEVRRSQPRDVYNPNFYQYSKCYQLNFSWSSPFPPFFNSPLFVLQRLISFLTSSFCLRKKFIWRLSPFISDYSEVWTVHKKIGSIATIAMNHV